MIERKKGVALIWSLVIGTILILVSTTMAEVILKESRMSGDITMSAKALSAAQAGVEWAKTCLGKSDFTCPAGPTRLNLDTQSYTDVTISGPVGNVWTIGSIGVGAGSVRRKIEFKYTSADPVVIAGQSGDDGSKLNNTLTATGNYSMSFYYWGTASPGSTAIGLGNGSTPVLYIEFPTDTSHVKLAAKIKDGGADRLIESSAIDIGGLDYTNQYKTRMTIDYLKGLAAKLTVQNGSGDCVSSVNIDLSSTSYVIPDISSFYFSPSKALDTTGTYGDDNLFKVGASSFIDAITVKGITLSSNWLTGPGAFMVYYQDLANAAWGPASSCPGTICQTGIDGTALSFIQNAASNIFNPTYPAQSACYAIGGRLPTTTELSAIMANKAPYGTFSGTVYWTATEASSTQGKTYNTSNAAGAYGKGTSLSVRCVK